MSAIKWWAFFLSACLTGVGVVEFIISDKYQGSLIMIAASSHGFLHVVCLVAEKYLSEK